jgi:predicted Zn-dependent peptidase
LLLDAFFSPRFLAADVETERSVVDAEFDLVQDSPGEVAAERALEACWNGHPLARPVLGDRSVVRGLDGVTLERFHHRTFNTGRVVAVVVGPVDQRAVESRLGRVGRGGSASSSLRPPEWHPGLMVEHRDGLEQVYVNLVLPALPTGHPETLTLGVLHQLLGAGNSSRLFRELRDRRGLVYDVGSAVFAGSVAGILEVVFSAPPRNLAGCWEGVCSILEDVGRGGINDREVELAVQALRSGMVLGSEGNDALLEAHAGEFLTYGRRFEMDRLMAELDAVTPGRVRSLARRLIRPEAIGGAVCGPGDGVALPGWLPERAA